MGFIVKGVKKVIGGVTKVIGAILSPILGFLVSKPKRQLSNQRLNKTLEPEDCRKIVFGKTASALDLRFWQIWGSKGTKYDEVIALATHRINSVLEFYCEEELAINAAGAVQSAFSSVLSRSVNLGLPGQSALVVGDGTQWNAQSTFDHVAHMVLRWIPDEKKLPNGVPSRYTQVIEGAPVYDPRRDSTVPGGSGTHRINDRTTWAYATLDSNGQPIGRNNALQGLWYELGWQVPEVDAAGVPTGDMVLLAGRGVLPEDINLATFIAGANDCESAGYYTDMILSTEDAHTTNEAKITCDGLIGQLIDVGGLWSYYANVNDTAAIAVELTDDDVLQGTSITWNEYQPMSDQYVRVAGKCIDPSPNVLYQLKDYPLVRDATYEAALNSRKRRTQDFEQIQDYALAQKLARLLLNMGQFQGEFGAAWKYKALRAQAWSVVRYTSERFDFVKLFRVMRQDITTAQGIAMTLREVDASIWAAGSVVAPQAAQAGTKYNPRQEIAIEGLTASAYAQTGGGANATIVDGVRVSWTAPPINVRRTEVRYRVVGATYWETTPPAKIDVTSVAVLPLISGTTYEIQARHISIHEVEGPWIGPAGGNFTVGSTGNLNWAQIKAAQDAAALASGNAAAAQADASNALGKIANITNDGLLDKSEKPGEVQRFNAVLSEYAGIVANAAVYAQSSAAYTTAKNALNTYLTGLTPAYTDYATDTAIVRATYNTKWQDYFDARQALLNAIAVEAGLRATWTNVRNSDPNSPDDNADVTLVNVAGGYVGQTPWGTLTTPVSSVLQPRRNLVFNAAPKLGLQGWTAVGGAWGVTAGPNGDMFVGVSGSVLYSSVFYCGNWVNVILSLEAFNHLTSNPRAWVHFSTNSDGSGYVSSLQLNLASTTWIRQISTAMLPSAEWARVALEAGTIAAGGYSLFQKIKVEEGSASSPFTDEATNGALYRTGQPIDVLQPGEVGANVTETRIATGYYGQTAWGTRTQLTINWGSEFAGFPTWANDGRAGVGLDATGDLARDLTLSRLNTSNVFRRTGGGLFTGETNADYTLTHVASGYVGQTAWGTLGVTTTRVSRINDDGYIQGNVVYRLESGSPVMIDARWPQEAGANVTEGRIAGGYYGQTPWGTLTVPTSDITNPRSNLLFNGSFRLGWQNWNLNGPSLGVAVGGSDPNSFYVVANTTTNSYIYSETYYTWPGSQLCLSCEQYQYLVTGTFGAYIQWMDASGVIGSTSRVVASNWDRAYIVATAPAGTTGYRVVWDSGNVAGGYSLLRKIKVEAATTPSPYSDEATNGAIYRNGVNMDLLRPGEFGANITENRIATGYYGQTAWGTYATLTPTQIANRTQYFDSSNGRALTTLVLGTATIVGIRSTNDVAMTSTDAGVTATINVPTHERRVPGASGMELRTYNSGSIVGQTFTTNYFVYCDDPGFAGGAVTYNATTNSDDLAGSINRVYVGPILTVNDGGTGGGGGGWGGGGGGGGGVIP